MSETLLRLTEPTASSLDPIPIVGPTSNYGFIGSLELDLATPSAEIELDADHCTADDLRLQFFHSVADQPVPRIRHISIQDLGDAGYRILKPIPVELKTVEVGDVEASFREANIAMSGTDSSDALQALVADILDTFDVLISEHNLGPDAATQRRLLRTYIVRT